MRILKKILPFIFLIQLFCLSFTYKTIYMKKVATTKNRSTRAKTRASVYEPVSRNIYFDGFSYRVRISVDGVKQSRNFSSKKAATAFRRQAELSRATA